MNSSDEAQGNRYRNAIKKPQRLNGIFLTLLAFVVYSYRSSCRLYQASCLLIPLLSKGHCAVKIFRTHRAMEKPFSCPPPGYLCIAEFTATLLHIELTQKITLPLYKYPSAIMTVRVAPFVSGYIAQIDVMNAFL